MVIWPYIWDIYGILYIIFHFLVRNIGCGIDKAILDLWELYKLVDDRMDFSYMHIRYFIRYVYHIRLQDTIQSRQQLCLLCQAMLLPMPLPTLLLTTRSAFNTAKRQAGGNKTNVSTVLQRARTASANRQIRKTKQPMRHFHTTIPWTGHMCTKPPTMYCHHRHRARHTKPKTTQRNNLIAEATPMNSAV